MLNLHITVMLQVLKKRHVKNISLKHTNTNEISTVKS